MLYAMAPRPFENPAYTI